MIPLIIIYTIWILACCILTTTAFTKVVVPAVYKDWDLAKPDWTSLEMQKKYNFTISVYQKHYKNETNYVRNRGTEAGVFLRYIVDNYYQFPDVAFFVHGLPEDHQPHWLSYLNCVSPHVRFFNINWRFVRHRDVTEWHEKGDNVWIEQCVRDVLKIVWNLTDYESLEKHMPLDKPISMSFYCCQQFVVSRHMIHHRPYAVWKALLQIINEQDACHLGEPDYEHLYAYKYGKAEKVGPEPSYLPLHGELEGKGTGIITQGNVMELLAHVIYGHEHFHRKEYTMDEVCSNFLSECPASPCKPGKLYDPKSPPRHLRSSSSSSYASNNSTTGSQ